MAIHNQFCHVKMNYITGKVVRKQVCHVIRCPHGMRCNNARNYITQKLFRNRFCNENILHIQGNAFETIKLCNVNIWAQVVCYLSLTLDGEGMSAATFNFQSPAVHWMAPTPSLNWFSCNKIPYQSLHSLNALPSFSEKALLFTDFCFVASPSPNSVPRLSGMFRRSASLAIPHRKSFAAIPSVSLVLRGHTNRSVKLSHESQREIALV